MPEVRSSIAALQACAAEHVRAYTDPRGRRAFTTYDRQGDPDRLTPLDCLAPALLSVPMGYRQVVPLFWPDGPGAVLLRAMQAVLEHPAARSADFLDTSLDPSCAPWALVDAALAASGEAEGVGVSGVKAVAVTKILHRKRPRLVPIFDSAVYRFYTGQAPPRGAYGDIPRRLWPLLQADLRANRDWLTELAAGTYTPDGRPLSLLRAADIVLWEHQATRCTAFSTP
ncbi:DUF6308 family protein [Streptomyces violens]|uniref:DUF6308 family protein n=1 Tax=Streptomyces violens TaxID=66377 RepID=UPI0012FF57AF|nr:DUF6308 family protein [Streptomyces violens]